MKFTNEKYPFVKLIADRKYEEIEWKFEDTKIKKELFKIGVEEVRTDKLLQTVSIPMLTKGLELFGLQFFSFFKKLKPCTGLLLIPGKIGAGLFYLIDPDLYAVFMLVLIEKQIVGSFMGSFNGLDFINKGKEKPHMKIDWKMYLSAVVILNMLLQFVKTEVVIIGGEKSPNKTFIGGIKFLSDLPVAISHYDCSWFREIIRNAEFGVRPHFRLQRCGIGRKDYKLILIKAFVKHGYHRRAKKDLINEPK